MLKFALKNLWIRRARFILVTLSIVISAGVALLAYNISNQVSDGIVSTAAYYDLIIGPSGSSTQLAMNTMFFTDKPLGTIPYSYVTELEKSGCANCVVPFTMGDSFNSARIVGTTPAFLEGKSLKAGDMFSDVYEAVIGASVAETYHLSVGSQIVTSHGLSANGAEHSATPLTVVGILKKSDTAYDNTIFTSYRTVWAVHGSEEHEEEGEEEEEEHEAHEGEVCAILVKSKSFNDYYKLTDYYGQDSRLLCINPSTVLREVLNSVDTSSRIIYLLCAIILAMNIMVITVITMLNLFDSKKEISLMRLIGIGMKRIALLYTVQNGILGIISTCLAMLLSHLCLRLMGSFVASMGIVLSETKVYGAEWGIMALVFFISVVPTLICTLRMAAKDSLNN